MKTIFEEIIEGSVSCDKVFEDNEFIVIKDRFPQAPVHLLIIPKKHIAKIQDMSKEDYQLLAHAMPIIQKLTKQFGINEGYRLVINNGVEGGQSVFHLHIHLIGGASLASFA